MKDDFFMSDILYLIGFIIGRGLCIVGGFLAGYIRSEEHTSELQSP